MIYYFFADSAQPAVIKRRRGAPKKATSLSREATLKKCKDQLVKDGNLISSGEEIFFKIGKHFNVSSQTIYLQAKRMFSREIASPKYKPTERIEALELSEEYDHKVAVNVKEDDLIQSFVESNAYVRGLRSYLRLMIMKYSYFTCDWHFDVCCSRENTILCSGKCSNPECSGKVFITSNEDRSILHISLKGEFFKFKF